MNQICIRIPSLGIKRTVDLEIRIDGRIRYMSYRVESIEWAEQHDPALRVERLKQFLRDYDRNWELVNIGTPAGTVLPVTFRQRAAAALPT
jgi:hypothetical protein